MAKVWMVWPKSQQSVAKVCAVWPECGHGLRGMSIPLNIPTLCPHSATLCTHFGHTGHTGPTLCHTAKKMQPIVWNFGFMPTLSNTFGTLWSHWAHLWHRRAPPGPPRPRHTGYTFGSQTDRQTDRKGQHPSSVVAVRPVGRSTGSCSCLAIEVWKHCYYGPACRLRPPVIVNADALVRAQHPEGRVLDASIAGMHQQTLEDPN